MGDNLSLAVMDSPNEAPTASLLARLFGKGCEAIRPLRFRGKRRILNALCPKKGTLETTLFGYDVRLDIAEWIQRHMLLGTFAEDAEAHVRRVLKEGDTFVDIGANVGFFTLLASSLVGPKGRVIAIEPNPPVFGQLAATVERNAIGNVTLVNAGLAPQEGTLALYVPADPLNHTATMVEHEGAVKVEVPVRRLDDLLDELGVEWVDYLKIDVDGFEPDVFAGAQRLLSGRRIHRVQSEFSNYWLGRHGTTAQAYYDMLLEAGFEDPDGRPEFSPNCLFDRFLHLKD